MSYNLDQFTDSFINTALELMEDSEGRDLAPETWEQVKEDCEKFFSENREKFHSLKGSHGCSVYQMAGHDFFLTREGHGAGFWDGDYLEPQASQLTEAAEKFAPLEFYVGDDGKIYR